MKLELTEIDIEILKELQQAGENFEKGQVYFLKKNPSLIGLALKKLQELSKENLTHERFELDKLNSYAKIYQINDYHCKY